MLKTSLYSALKYMAHDRKPIVVVGGLGH